ncbi:unnamed protein product, partial [Discosporangium mesarthrocarpum]
MNPGVQVFLRHIESSNGVYKYRWGDSPVQALAAKVFFDPSTIQPIPGVAYVHGSHG